MLWLLRNTGHGLLVTDREEYGSIGSRFLKDSKFPFVIRERFLPVMMNRFRQFQSSSGFGLIG